MESADIICIHQGEDGTVCGEAARGKGHDDGWIDVSHPAVPGGKCPTCDGGRYELIVGWSPNTEVKPCPTCADSPVRGYVELE